ncbi:MAG: hypothetical protein AB7S75_10920 [Desulfococcaceae bacterium]
MKAIVAPGRVGELKVCPTVIEYKYYGCNEMNKINRSIVATFLLLLIVVLTGCKDDMDMETAGMIKIFTGYSFVIATLSGIISMFGRKSPIIESAG